MRKNAGLSGDLDRIPQLAWILFLKAFDGLERNREITDPHFRPAIEEPYRWRDWAADRDGLTGERLINFVNARLLRICGASAAPAAMTRATCWQLSSRRPTTGCCRATFCAMSLTRSTRLILLLLTTFIPWLTSMSRCFARCETRLETRESFIPLGRSSDSSFSRSTPRLGQVILDPACGTGGFLVEALEYLAPAVKTTQQRRELHANIRGIEKKPLPYLLGMMNLVLHGVGQPNITRANALSEPIMQEFVSTRRVEIVVTNPPFGAAEELSIQANFPSDKQTSENAWLFLQLVIRQLNNGGRCGIVVPNSVLFGDGVGTRIKQQLFAEV